MAEEGEPHTPQAEDLELKRAVEEKYLKDRVRQLETEQEETLRRLVKVDSEMADFSSTVMDEANIQVETARRETAMAEAKLERLAFQIQERDILIESQKQQLDVLKAMIARPEQSLDDRTDISYPKISTEDLEGAELAAVLVTANYSSPLRPHILTGGPEYRDFVALAEPLAPSRINLGQTKSKKAGLSSYRFGAQLLTLEIEPALRLDNSLHLSWLTRRAMLNAVLDGTLQLDPIPSSERVWASRPSVPCCFCGESGSQPQYARLHLVRVPKDTAAYAIGNECIMRVRFACELTALLRSIRDGLRKVDTPQAAEAAYSDCLRLREQLFWARTGGFYPQAPQSQPERVLSNMYSSGNVSPRDKGEQHVHESETEQEFIDAIDTFAGSLSGQIQEDTSDPQDDQAFQAHDKIATPEETQVSAQNQENISIN